MPQSSLSRFAFPQSGPSRLTWLYIAALSAVALLSVAGQAVVQLCFDRQMSDANVINVAGRQRMLSQRIAKAALAVRDAAPPAQQAERYEELRATLALWERCHRGLQQGDAELGLPGGNSPEVQRMFADLEPSFSGVLLPAERLYAASGGSPRPASTLTNDLAEILRHESSFLRGMDGIVSQYAFEASRRVTQVKRIEQALLALTLAVLLLEGRFVFRPAVRRIRTTLAALQATSTRLAAAKEAAEEANQAKTRFLAVTSHELRTPLHAVLGIAEQLQKSPLDAAQRQAIAVLHDAATTLLALVSDLLDLARIESGKLELRMEPVALGPLVDQTLSLVRPAAEGKGLLLSVDRAAEAPAAIITDGLRLGQVLLNLLSNAVKFTDRGSVRLTIDRLPDVDGRARLRFNVADTGIGIPPDQQQRIFESFSQVDASLSRARGGVGLGLAISRRLAELLGGSLELASQPGCGSQFTLTIACAIAHRPETAERAASSSELPVGQAALPTGRSVLVIDDGPANRYLASALLREAGYEVEVASCGKEALRLIGIRSFDAALLDVHMPGMDGWELARAIGTFQSEHARPRMPIIALTADVLAETRSRLLQHSIDAVLHKPASGESILKTLAAVLQLPLALPHGTARVPSNSTDGHSAVETRRSRSLARLRGNEALLADLTAIFRRDSELQQAAVEDAFQRLDGDALRQAVHRLRGQAMTFDAIELCGLLAKMEEHALAGDLQPCTAYWIDAARELELLREALGRGAPA